MVITARGSRSGRVLGSIGASLGLLCAWAGLGAAEVVVTYMLAAGVEPSGSSRVVGPNWLVLAIIAAVAMIALAWISVLLIRRPTPDWPDVELAAALLGSVAFLAGIGAVLGGLFGLSVLPVPFELWLAAAGLFLPAVALTEALAAGSGQFFHRRSPHGAARRTAVLVALAHVVWFAGLGCAEFAAA